MQGPSEGQVIPVLVCFWHWGKSEKLDPNTPNQGQRYTESHPKC